MKQNKFWQRQKCRIKAWERRNVLYLSSYHNAEAAFLAKPRRVTPEAIISVVAHLVKAISIPCEVRLGYDGFRSHRIHSASRMLPTGRLAHD